MKKTIFLVFTLFLLLWIPNCSGSGPSKTEGKTRKEVKQAGEKDKNKEDIPGKKGDKDDDTDAVPVQVISPENGDISSFMLFSSNIDSEKVVNIFPMTSGIIEKINYDEGDSVKKGTVLAVLDDREAAINEEKSRINYQQLKMEFKRQEEIFERQLVSKEEYERLKFSLEKARLDWEQNKLFLSYTRITSPIAGVVTHRYIKTGNKISTSQMAFSVVQDKEKIAVVNIPEQEKEHVFLRQESAISSDSREVPGFVKRISPAIDPESGTFKVTIEVEDRQGALTVGQFVNVKIIKKVHKNALLLTKDALIYEEGRIFVFVLDKENKALKRAVELGFESGNKVEVTRGLKGEDRVVTAGKSSLKNKTLVKIIEPIT